MNRTYGEEEGVSPPVVESSIKTRARIALMSYTIDNRRGKGTAIYARTLIEHMIEDDRFEFSLVHYDRVNDALYGMAQEIVIPEIPRLPFGTRFLRTMLFFWEYRHHRFDIIHWFQPRLYPFFWLAPAKHLVVTAHGAGDITAPYKFIFSRSVFNFLMIHFNRFLAAIIADSEFGKEEIREWYRVEKEKVHTIHIGGGDRFRVMPKDSARREIAKKYGIDSSFILDIARLEPNKNVLKVVEAYILARKRYGIREKLVIVGFKGHGHEKILETAHESPYKNDIVFLDYVAEEDLNAFYSAAELFVFPSLNEGFGLPVVEAFSVGVPVITSNVSALPEIAGDAAVLVDPRNSADIARAIHDALSNPSLRELMIQKGLARARNFTWDKTAKETLTLYNTLLSKS